MRLWHKDLINVLPKAQLTGLWREINAIFNDKTNNPIINYVRDYGKEHYYNYCKLVINEFYKRGFKIYSFKRYNDYFNIEPDSKNIPYNDISIDEIFKKKMDNVYLRQCLCNLEEKAMVNLITPEEWDKIWQVFGERFNLWHPAVKKNKLIEQNKLPSWTHSFSENVEEDIEEDDAESQLYEEKEEEILKEREKYVPLPNERCDRCYYLNDTGFRYTCCNSNSINFGKTMRPENACDCFEGM